MNKIKAKYNKLPTKIFKMGLSVHGVALYSFCLSLPEDFDPSLNYCIKRLKMGRTKLVETFKELTDSGVLAKIETGNSSKVSKYEFTNPASWKVKSDKEEW